MENIVKLLQLLHGICIKKSRVFYKEKSLFFNYYSMSLFSDELNKALIYSSTDLKISDLREQAYFSSLVDTKKYEQISQWCQKTSTFATTADESDYHFKL